MSQQMRDLMSQFASLLNESSVKRVYNHLIKHDCAIITSYRKSLTNCLDNDDEMEYVNIRTNKNRNRHLKSTLLYLGYGVTKVKGTYVENFAQQNAIEVNEESFFVVNMKNDPDFIYNMTKLGELFCQDSVMIIERGGDNNYLIGTNNSEYPGYGNIEKLGEFKPDVEAEFMTRVGGRPFSFESFDLLQNNTKRLVSEDAKILMKFL
jgi:hypothetical protein